MVDVSDGESYLQLAIQTIKDITPDWAEPILFNNPEVVLTLGLAAAGLVLYGTKIGVGGLAYAMDKTGNGSGEASSQPGRIEEIYDIPIVTTGMNVYGSYRPPKYDEEFELLGLVDAYDIRTKSIISDAIATVQDALGGELKRYVDVRESGVNSVRNKIQKKAKAIGADFVLDYTQSQSVGGSGYTAETYGRGIAGKYTKKETLNSKTENQPSEETGKLQEIKSDKQEANLDIAILNSAYQKNSSNGSLYENTFLNSPIAAAI